MPKSEKKSRMKQSRKSKRIMKGGQLTQAQEEHLIQTNEFTQEQIDYINNNNISIDDINQAITEYQTNPHELIIKRAKQIRQQNNLNVSGDSSVMSIIDPNDLNGVENDDIPQDPGHVDDIPQDPGHVNDMNISDDDTSFESIGSQDGGKRRTKKRRNIYKKSRKNIKQKGGICYGNGVGANNYDPNYSIYNTNLLKLFPYKPQ